jgi:hypothetical protein
MQVVITRRADVAKRCFQFLGLFRDALPRSEKAVIPFEFMAFKA